MEISEINAINDRVENQEGLTGSEKLAMMQSLYDCLDTLEEPAIKARTLFNYAAAVYYNGDTERAHQLGLETYKLTHEHNLDDVKMKVCNLLGSINSGMSRHALGLDYYHQALRLAIAQENQRLKSSLINNIAILYSLMKMYDRARSYFAEAQEISAQTHNYFNYFLTTHNLLDLALETEDHDAVARHYSEAREIYVLKRDLHRYKGMWYLIEAKYLRINADYDMALEKLDEAIEIFKLDDDVAGCLEAQLERGRNLFGKEQFEAALAVCETASKNAYVQNNYEIERDAIKLYLRIQKQLLSEQPGLMALRLVELDDLLMKNLFEVSVYQLEEKLEIELEQEICQKNDRLLENMRFIYEISKEMSSEQDYQALIHLIIEKLKSFMDFDAIVIGLHDTESQMIVDRITYHNGRFEKSFDVQVNNKSSLAAWSIRHKRDIYTGTNSHLEIDDFEPLYINFPDIKVPYETVYYVPLIVDQAVIGVFSLQKYEVNGFDAYQIEMIRAIASYIAIAINNALKTEKMQRLNEELANQSRRDALSSLLNRRALNDDLKYLVALGKRQSLSISTIMCDIDYFKEYNDAYGHVEGDAVIQAVAGTLLGAGLEYTPYVYRYGGDEFLMMFIGADEALVQTIGEGVLNGVGHCEIPHTEKGIGGIVTVSIGIAFFEAIVDEDDVLRGADAALYASKRKGRNQIRTTRF